MENERKKLVAKLKERHAQVKAMRQPLEPVIQEVLDLVCPHRSDFITEITDWSKVGKRIYDGTPQSCLMIWVDGIQANIISSALDWFDFTTDDETLLEDGDVKDWLKDVKNRVYKKLGQSNFYQAFDECAVDIGSNGTANLFIHENMTDGRIHCNVEHPKNVWLVNNLFGEVEEVHVIKKMTLHEASREYGEHNLSPASRMLLGTRPYESIEVLRIIAPNHSPIPGATDLRSMAYRSYHVELANSHLIRTGGYWTLPGAFLRARTRNGFSYGISNGEMAMTTIKRLYAMGKSLLHAGQLAARPFWQAPREMKGKLNLSPDGVNYYDDVNRLIRPGSTGASYPIGADREEQARDVIKRWYSVDFFLAMQQARGERTAEEIRELQSERTSLLGPQMERLSTDLDSAIRRVYELMWQAGQIPDPPDILAQQGGEPIRIVYIGPLFKWRKQNYILRPIRQAMQDVLMLSQIDPTVLDHYDLGELSRFMSENNGGLPAHVIRDKQQVEQIRSSRQQAQQAQAMMTAIQQGADAAAALQKPTDPDSPLSALVA